MDTSVPPPTTTTITTTKLRFEESLPSSSSTPIAATPTTLSFQLDAEADAELYGPDLEHVDTKISTLETLPPFTEKSPFSPPGLQPTSGGGIPGLFLINDPPPTGEGETEAMTIDTEYSTGQPLPRDEETAIGKPVDSTTFQFLSKSDEVIVEGLINSPTAQSSRDGSTTKKLIDLSTSIKGDEPTTEESVGNGRLGVQDFEFPIEAQARQTVVVKKEPVEEPDVESRETVVNDNLSTAQDQNATVKVEAIVKVEAGVLDTDMPDRVEDGAGMEGPSPPLKDPVDPNFIAAGEANKSNPEAEWELDSSDSDTSSNSSSDSDSEADSEDDYPMMDHEQLAKLLMREDGGDDEDLRKEGSQGPLKTKNEIPEEAVPIPRPDIIVTPEMKLELLGAIETIVGTMILIKAFVSGDHQVLNEGSLLCFEDRSIVGVVADTFGRVEEPLYTVRFNTPEEITKTGASLGQKVYYVPEHSDYVFTQALKGLKGSDASNIFDEEVGEAEQEFSDDEAEAEYKRQRKYARQVQSGGTRGGRGRGGGGSSAARSQNPTARETDELYTPLTRPSNLAELMNGPPPLPPLNGSGGNRGERGHQRGGRGDRGGRGRGRGGQRGGRGRDGHEFRKRDRDGDQGRGDHQDRDERASLSAYQSHPQNYKQQSGEPHPTYAPQSYQYQQQQPQQQSPQFQSQQFQSYQSQQQQWTPPPNLTQFPRFPGYPPPSPYQPYPPHTQPNFYQVGQTGSPGGQFPPTLPQGAHVNPAFFRGGRQQQQESMPAPPGRNDFHWSPSVSQGQHFSGGQQQQGQQQDTEAAFRALQDLVSMSNQMRNSANLPPPPPPLP